MNELKEKILLNQKIQKPKEEIEKLKIFIEDQLLDDKATIAEIYK